MSETLGHLIINCIRLSTRCIPEGMPDAIWTFKIKQGLTDLGISLGYRVCASGVNEATAGEWLYDLVWYDMDELGFLRSVPLVLESEWLRSLSDIKYDFEKLLVSNAPYKIMICQNGKESVGGLIQYFQTAIKSFNNSALPCVYVVAIFDNDIFGFRFYIFDEKGKAQV